MHTNQNQTMKAYIVAKHIVSETQINLRNLIIKYNNSTTRNKKFVHERFALLILFLSLSLSLSYFVLNIFDDFFFKSLKEVFQSKLRKRNFLVLFYFFLVKIKIILKVKFKNIFYLKRYFLKWHLYGYPHVR